MIFGCTTAVCVCEVGGGEDGAFPHHEAITQDGGSLSSHKMAAGFFPGPPDSSALRGPSSTPLIPLLLRGAPGPDMYRWRPVFLAKCVTSLYNTGGGVPGLRGMGLIGVTGNYTPGSDLCNIGVCGGLSPRIFHSTACYHGNSGAPPLPVISSIVPHVVRRTLCVLRSGAFVCEWGKLIAPPSPSMYKSFYNTGGGHLTPVSGGDLHPHPPIEIIV